MLSIMLLVVASRCADLTVCPSDSELISALIAYDENIRKLTVDTAAQKGELVLFHLLQNPYGLKDVNCGERELGESSTVTCGFTAKYTTHDVHQVVKLMRQNGTWRIVEGAAVKGRNF